MSDLGEKRIKTKRLYKGTLIGLRRDTVELPNGKTSTREIVEHPGAVAVVAITKEDELVLIRQFRTPTKEILLEVPAGVPKKGEAGEVCAARELQEETGFHAKKVKKVWEGFASPGYSDELIRFYLAQDMVKIKQNLDEDEFVEVNLIDVETCMDLLKLGKIRDNKTMIGIMIADLYLKGELK
ncbi:MAG: NUDIX hydrolase [Candidatus Margulisbacteria bacterium]|nr:NUDIX hydrolase [Candidatus Margulisiibacteriota bacterium]